jgi:hypothetical protein
MATDVHSRALAIASAALLATGCAFQTRGILHSNLREPLAIDDAAVDLQLLRRARSPASGDAGPSLTGHGYLDAKSCSTNVLGWATGDASLHAAYEALRQRMRTELKPSSPDRSMFVTELQTDRSYYGWLGLYSETCTFVGGQVFEGP